MTNLATACSVLPREEHPPHIRLTRIERFGMVLAPAAVSTLSPVSGVASRPHRVRLFPRHRGDVHQSSRGDGTAEVWGGELAYGVGTVLPAVSVVLQLSSSRHPAGVARLRPSSRRRRWH